ncbi:MAG: hypothetical protein DLM61_07735 [Pseudonocardiales bacterium]|nr:MAG: hypothetical protein DLM61_07735 [Pseudonocardiales bacterium]
MTRALRIETLRGRIDRSEYQVDVYKVAEAILGRPAAHVWLLPASIRVVGSDKRRSGRLPPPRPPDSASQRMFSA